MTVTLADVLAARPTLHARLRARATSRHHDPDAVLSNLYVACAQTVMVPGVMPEAQVWRWFRSALASARKVSNRRDVESIGDRDWPGRHSTNRLGELRDILRAMDAKTRRVFVLLAAGHQAPEIAAQVGMSPASVRQLVSRTRKILRAL